MEDDVLVIYGLEFQAWAPTPQTAETDAIRFLVGMQSLKYDNQSHIIDFDDENIINKNILLHQVDDSMTESWEVPDLNPSPALFSLCKSGTSLQPSMSRAPPLSNPSDPDSRKRRSSTGHQAPSENHMGHYAEALLTVLATRQHCPWVLSLNQSSASGSGAEAGSFDPLTVSVFCS
ncbi:Protein TSSC1 [Fukomys damarensis]|uniref:Protein TSSC1 n=1 Tax=Fukomys damarensis TaxID=885580 RepID=A0A091DYH0_FUKDA|nr:Protein TSSC1 [Fukomys damarensis]